MQNFRACTVMTIDATEANAQGDVGAGIVVQSTDLTSDEKWALMPGGSRRAAMISLISAGIEATLDTARAGDHIDILTPLDRHDLLDNPRDMLCPIVAGAKESLNISLNRAMQSGISIAIDAADPSDFPALGRAQEMSAHTLMIASTDQMVA